jgi:hypothetical protein
VRELANGAKQTMNVARMAYAQGGRVLIGCDNITFSKEISVPHRITLWDTKTGSVAHQIALPAGLPTSVEVSPNGRYLVAMIDEGDSGLKLSAWRLDGESPEKDVGLTPPATGRP